MKQDDLTEALKANLQRSAAERADRAEVAELAKAFGITELSAWDFAGSVEQAKSIRTEAAELLQCTLRDLRQAQKAHRAGRMDVDRQLLLRLRGNAPDTQPPRALARRGLVSAQSEKALRAARREAGLCAFCRAPSARYRCPPCRAIETERQRAARASRRRSRHEARLTPPVHERADPDCDDPVTVHASIDRRDAAVGVMWDRVDVDSIVYPDGREVHYSDLPDAVLAGCRGGGRCAAPG